MSSFQYWFLITVIWVCTALIGNDIRTAIRLLKEILSSIDSLQPEDSETT